MSTNALRRLRMWIVLLSLLNMGVIAVSLLSDGLDLYHIILAFLAIVFFFSYFYSLKGEPFIHKYLRAFLMLVLIGFLLFLSFVFIMGRGHCECPLFWINSSLGVIIGFFSLFEIGLTLKTGPLAPKSRYGQNGNRDQANVVIVSPDQPQGLYPLQHQQPGIVSPVPYYYTQHQSMYGAPVPSPGHKIDTSSPLVDNNGQQQQQQQQVYQQQPYIQQQQPTSTSEYQPTYVVASYSAGGSQSSPVATPHPTTCSPAGGV